VQAAVKDFDPIVRAAVEISVYNTYKPEDSREYGEKFPPVHSFGVKKEKYSQFSKSYTHISIQIESGAK
jgi:hypothetical protein